MLVFLDTPSNKSGIYISGGQMAAPVVGSMLADILPYMGVEAETDCQSTARPVMPMAVGQSLARRGGADKGGGTAGTAR